MSSIIFHLKNVKAVDEKVLSEAELKEDFLSENAKINFPISKRTKKEE